MKTALTASQFRSEAARLWFPKLHDYVAQRRNGQPPKLAAGLVVFLASGRADALSGRFIDVRDDVTEMVQRAQGIRQEEQYTLRLRTWRARTCSATGLGPLSRWNGVGVRAKEGR